MRDQNQPLDIKSTSLYNLELFDIPKLLILTLF